MGVICAGRDEEEDEKGGDLFLHGAFAGCTCVSVPCLLLLACSGVGGGKKQRVGVGGDVKR